MEFESNAVITGIEMYPGSGTISYTISTLGPNSEAKHSMDITLPFSVAPLHHAPNEDEIAIMAAHIMHLTHVNNALQHQVLDLQKSITNLMHQIDGKADKQPSA